MEEVQAEEESREESRDLSMERAVHPNRLRKKDARVPHEPTRPPATLRTEHEASLRRAAFSEARHRSQARRSHEGGGKGREVRSREERRGRSRSRRHGRHGRKSEWPEARSKSMPVPKQPVEEPTPTLQIARRERKAAAMQGEAIDVDAEAEDSRHCRVRGGEAGWEQHIRSVPHLAMTLWEEGKGTWRSWEQCRAAAKEESKKLWREWDAQERDEGKAEQRKEVAGKEKKQPKRESSPVVDRAPDQSQKKPPPDPPGGGGAPDRRTAVLTSLWQSTLAEVRSW